MELSTDKHYLPLDTKFPAVFEYAGQDVAVVQIHLNDGEAIENKLIRGKVDGIKVGEEDNGLEGAVIGLFHPDDTEMTLESALVVTTSSETGEFSFEDIPYGHWVIRELSPPAMHTLSDELHHIYIGVDEQHIEIRIENTLIRGNVQLYKTDADNSNILLEGAVFEVFEDTNGNQKLDDEDILVGEMTEISTGIHEMRGLIWGNYLLREKTSPTLFHADKNAYYFEIRTDGETVIVENAEGKGFTNKPMTGNLRILKTSSDGKKDGFSFRVTGPNGYDKTYTTDGTGAIYIEGLRVGKYTISEVSNDASAGYILPDPVTVEIPTDQTVEVKFHNNKVTVTVPKTGDNTNLFILFAALIAGLGALAALAFVYLKRRGATEPLLPAQDADEQKVDQTE